MITDMTHSQKVLLALLGVAAGFLSGFLGIGGGLVIVPALMLLLSYPIKRAVGISLATIVPVSILGVLADLWMKPTNIHWGLALALTAGSFLGSVVGGRLVSRLPDAPLRLLFAGALLVAAYRMLPAVTAAHAGLMLVIEHPAIGDALALPVGAVAGITSTLFGLGGGIVTVPCLAVLFRDIPFHAARATSLVTIVPTSGFGAFQHQRMGTVDFGIVRRLIPTALIGAVLGVVSVNFISAAPCRTVFAGLLVLTAAKVLLAKRPAPASQDRVGMAIRTGRSQATEPAQTTAHRGGIDMNSLIRPLTGLRAAVLALVGVVLLTLVASGAAHVRREHRAAGDVGSPSWKRHVELVNELARGGPISLAIFTWQDAYALALASREWESLLEVGDAALAIGDASGSRVGWIPKARECYTTALFRARRQTSLEGVLRTTRALAALGDRDGTAQGLAIARSLASDPRSQSRVEELAKGIEQRDFAQVPVAPGRL
jgi:uncharacterized membrane protein YfcA